MGVLGSGFQDLLEQEPPSTASPLFGGSGCHVTSCLLPTLQEDEEPATKENPGTSCCDDGRASGFKTT